MKIKKILFFPRLWIILAAFCAGSGFSEAHSKSLSDAKKDYSAKNFEPIGAKLSRMIKEEKFEDALSLIESNKKFPNLISALNYSKALIAIKIKNRKLFLESIESLVSSDFLNNSHLVSFLYENSREDFRYELEKQLSRSNFFNVASFGSCPFFYLNERHSRAQLLFEIVSKKKVQSQVQVKIFFELYVHIPEVISSKKYLRDKNFLAMEKRLGAKDILQRIETLILFGQNDEALQTISRYQSKFKKFSPLDQCDLRYQRAKIFRKKKEYRNAQKQFLILAEDCREPIKIKARFMDAQIGAIRDDELAIERIDQFVKDYPHHSFSDDVLYYKATILKSLKRESEYEKCLETIIGTYPNGDMFSRVIFELALYSAAKNNLAKAKSLLKKYEFGATNKLEKAQAKYWQSRLDLFPQVGTIKNTKVRSSNPSVRNLVELATQENSSIYSWLARILLQNIQLESRFSESLVKKKPRANFEGIPKFFDTKINYFYELYQNGFYFEAQSLAKSFAVSGVRKENAPEVAQFFLRIGHPELGFRSLISCNKSIARHFSEQYPDLFNAISFPMPFENEMNFALENVQVPKAIMYSIIRRESTFLAKAKSWAQALGLAQVRLASAKELSNEAKISVDNESQLFDPKTNLTFGALILRKYYQRFGHYALALAAYNAGPNAVRRWIKTQKNYPLDYFIENIPYLETKFYVKEVLGATLMYAETADLPNLSLLVN